MKSGLDAMPLFLLDDLLSLFELWTAHTKTKIAKYSGGEHTVNLSKSSYNSASQEAIYRGRSYIER